MPDQRVERCVINLLHSLHFLNLLESQSTRRGLFLFIIGQETYHKFSETRLLGGYLF